MEYRHTIHDAHPKPVMCVQYNPFRREIYTAGEDAAIKVWESESGKLLNVWTEHIGWITNLLYCREIKVLFSCSIDGYLIAWGPSGKVLQKIQTNSPIYTLAYNSRRQQIMAGQNKKVRLFQLLSSDENHGTTDVLERRNVVCGEHSDIVSCIVSCEGRFYSAGYDRKIIIYDVPHHGDLKLRVSSMIKDAHDAAISCMVYGKDADNSWLITGSFDRVVKLWSLDGNLMQRFDGFNDTISSLCYVVPTQTLWITASSAVPVVYDPRSGINVSDFVRTDDDRFHPAGGTFSFKYLMFNSDTNEVIGISTRRSIVIWRYNSVAPLTVLPGHADIVECLTFTSKEPLLIFSGGDDGMIRKWERLQLNTFMYSQEVLALPKEEFVEVAGDVDTNGGSGSIKMRGIGNAGESDIKLGHGHSKSYLATKPSRVHSINLGKHDKSNHGSNNKVVKEKPNHIDTYGKPKTSKHNKPAPTIKPSVPTNTASAAVAAESDHPIATNNPQHNAGSTSNSRYASELALVGVGARSLAAKATRPGIVSLFYYEDLDYLVSGYEDSRICIWGYNEESIKFLPESDLDHEGGDTAQQIGQIGSDSVSNRVAGMALKATLLDHKDAVTGLVCFQVDGTHWMISTGWDRRICIWDLKTTTLHDVFRSTPQSSPQQLMMPHTQHLYGMDVTGRGELAADGIILALDFSHERCEFGYASSDKLAYIRKFSPNGTEMTLMAVLQGHEAEVTQIRWHKREKQWITGSEDRTIRIWPADGIPCLRVLNNDGPVTSLCIDAINGCIITGSQDKVIRVFDIDKKDEIVQKNIGHTDEIRSIIHIPARNQYVSASWDNTVRIWNAYLKKGQRRIATKSNTQYFTPAQETEEEPQPTFSELNPLIVPKLLTKPVLAKDFVLEKPQTRDDDYTGMTEKTAIEEELRQMFSDLDTMIGSERPGAHSSKGAGKPRTSKAVSKRRTGDSMQSGSATTNTAAIAIGAGSASMGVSVSASGSSRK